MSDGPQLPTDDATIAEVLSTVRTIAVVGASPTEARPSWYVSAFLQSHGYRIIPVNPRYAGAAILGEPVRAALSDIPVEDGPIDMVDIFRRSEMVGDVVDQALATLGPRGLSAIWMQLGVIDADAARRAEAAGVRVVMDRCPRIEIPRLFGDAGPLHNETNRKEGTP